MAIDDYCRFHCKHISGEKLLDGVRGEIVLMEASFRRPIEKESTKLYEERSCVLHSNVYGQDKLHEVEVPHIIRIINHVPDPIQSEKEVEKALHL